MKIKKVDAFIASVKADNKNDNAKILEAMGQIRKDLPNMIKNSSPDECKERIVTILGDYFKINTLTDAENKAHEALKKKITEANREDKTLFLNFADFVKCGVDCNDPAESTIETEGSRFNLRKKNGDEIVLLDLFSGSKDVSIIMKSEELSMFDKIKKYAFNGLKIAAYICAAILALYVLKTVGGGAYNLLFGTAASATSIGGNMKGGSKEEAQYLFAGLFMILVVSILYILSQNNVLEYVNQLASSIMGAGIKSIATAGLLMIVVGILITTYKQKIMKGLTDLMKSATDMGQGIIDGTSSAIDEIKRYYTDFDLGKNWDKVKNVFTVNKLKEFMGVIASSIQKHFVKIFFKAISSLTMSYIFNGIKIITGFGKPDDMSIQERILKTMEIGTLAEGIEIVSTKLIQIVESAVVMMGLPSINDYLLSLDKEDEDSSIPKVRVEFSETHEQPGETTNPELSREASLLRKVDVTSSSAEQGDRYATLESMNGGANVLCFKIPSLKQTLLGRLIKFGNENVSNNEFKMEQCDDVILSGKSFVIDSSKSINNASECEPAVDARSRTDKLDCLHKTGLKRRIKANTDESRRWTTLNKNMNSPNLLVTPNMLQILKGSTFPSAMNYQLGGGDIEENREFIKTKNQNIKIQYSYQIVSLLKKALQRLNNNGIYLDKKTIDEIQTKIEQLRDAETSLAKYAENIVQAGKISASRTENNSVMDDNKLNDYVKKHKMLVQNADKTAIKLNTVFIKLLELFNDKGDKIVSVIERSI